MGSNSGDRIFCLLSEASSDTASAQGLGRFSARRAPWRVQTILAMNRRETAIGVLLFHRLIARTRRPANRKGAYSNELASMLEFYHGQQRRELLMKRHDRSKCGYRIGR